MNFLGHVLRYLRSLYPRIKKDIEQRVLGYESDYVTIVSDNWSPVNAFVAQVSDRFLQRGVAAEAEWIGIHDIRYCQHGRLLVLQR